MLTRMHGRRLTAYKKIGFAFPVVGKTPPSPGGEMAEPRPPLLAPTSAGPRKARRVVPVSASQVRAWAKEHGIDVADRGRLRSEIWEQYHAGHPA
jgi:Lsr2